MQRVPARIELLSSCTWKKGVSNSAAGSLGVAEHPNGSRISGPEAAS